MEISNSAADMLAEVIASYVNDNGDDRVQLIGEVLGTDSSGTTWVHILGGEQRTPVTSTNAKVHKGDIVYVVIGDGRADILGNVSRPATDDELAEVVQQRVIETERVVERIEATAITAESAEIQQLNADHAVIETLDTTYASIDNLNAATARIGNIEADYLVASDMTAERARVGQLMAGKANVADLTAANGRIDNLESTKADISLLESDYITADAIEAAYLKTDMSNTDVAWIENGTIKNGAISSAMINDVSANKLTAGTINGSIINVTNLNADNITAGTINGQRIGEGSLSLDKLSEDVYTEQEVDDKLSAMQAEIDGAIETWTGTAVPTLNNSPASGWSTSDERDRHVGDVYFVVNSNSQQNGYNYRFTKTNGTYSWQLIKDSDVTNALQRLSTAEGKITTFDSDISKLKTDTGTLTTKTESLETRMSDAEDDILDKVDTTTFNEVSDTVDQHSQSITQMSQTLSNKADGSTVTALTNRVSKTEQDISGINTTIGTLQTTVESKADGSTVEAVSNRLNTVSDTVDGHTQSITSINSTLQTKADSSTVSSLTTKVNNVSDTVDGHTQTIGSMQTTQTQMQGKLDKTIVETTQLWYSKSSTDAPNKPTSQVTSTSTAGNAWRTVVPAYNASYPNYFYCYQWKYTGGTYGWSSVTRDIAMGESQERARTAITNAAAADTKAGNAASVAATAQSTAEGAASDASKAKTDAASAVSTANSAASDASTALSTANTANTNASTAVSTANTAAADASTAKTNASTAVSTANTAKATADKNVKSTLQLWYTKANDTAPSKPTSKVTSTSVGGNAWRVVVPTYSASYPYYFYCYQYELADGTYTWSDVVYDRATTENQSNSRSAVADVSTLTTKTNTISDTVDGHTSQLSSITSTQTTIQGSAVKSTVQLWFTKANTTAPNKPTAHVTTNNASTANAWNLAVPTYNASYPNYFYCYEYQYLNDTYGWSAVTRDIATGEAQSTARTAASDASSAVSTANTANTNASNAVSTANTANTNASNAVSTANTANTNASNAVSTANTAAADASTAKTDAASAVSTANTASTNASAAVSTANTAKATADKNVKETILLWYSKANSTAPSKPTSAVTSTSTAGNDWRVVVPTYSASYPYYFYCYQYKLADGTYAWSSVVYDQATTEAQSTARAASSSLATYITSNDAAIQSLQNQVDGQIEAWYYSVDPTTSNVPASDWTTDALKARHEGDLYYNVTSGHSWRWLKNDSTYSWQQIPDSDAAAALAAAQNAQNTANNKRRIFTATPTVPYDKGDLWVNGSVVKYATTARSSGDYTASDWSTTATDDTAANAAQATANKNVRESQQLWFTKANSTAPSKPNSKVTSTATTGNAWTTRVPTYSDSYKYYFYCMQYIAADGTVTWSDVIYDQATTEAQSVARAASADLTEFHQEYATFKQTTQQFESTVGETYATKTEISDAKTYVANAKANYGYQYKKDIVIYGESSKYYPVYFTNVGAIPQTVTHEIMIRREYSEQAPSDWYTSTHKGGLNIHFGWNFGGWGGATYKCEVYEFTQQYSTMVGDVLVGADNGMFSIVYLRGGGTTGALYHVYSDVPFTRHAYMTNAGVVGENDIPYIGLEQGVKYAQSTTGDNPTYKWNVRAPLTAPNTAHLNELYTVQRTALIESRVSTAETAIDQNKTDITLKANASDVYTKQESDGLINTEVTNRNAAIQVSANAINQSVSETYTTKEDFKNLEIGGRNLLRNTGVVRSATANTYGVWDVLIPTYANNYALDLDAGEYVLSFDWTSSEALPANFYVWVGYGSKDGQGRADQPKSSSGPRYGSGKTSGHVIRTFEWPDANDTYPYFACRPFRDVSTNNLSGITFTVTNAKLEKGNKATDWTPAPEDIESQVSAIEQRVSTNETSISNNATQINLRAKSSDVYTKTQTDGLISTEVSERNAAIQVSANAINQSVSQNYTTKTEFNNLEIGGRNLFSNSATLKSTWVPDNGSAGGVVISDGVANLPASTNARIYQLPASGYWTWEANTEYAVSIEVKASSSSGKLVFNMVGAGGSKIETVDVSTSWKRYSWAFTSDSSVNTGSASFYNGSTSATIQLRLPKLERGNKATEWTPAPEDVDNAIASVPRMAKINTGSRSFTTALWKTYGATGHVENWTTGSSYDNSHLRVGDRAYLTGVISDQNNGSATIIGEVTAVSPVGLGTSSVTMKSEQLIFGGDVVSAVEMRMTSAESTIEQLPNQITARVSNEYATKSETQIDRSGSGTSALVDGAASATLKGLHILGESVQDGTPTPSAPIPIASVGAGTNLLTDTAVVDTSYYAKDDAGYYNINGINWSWGYAHSCVRVTLPAGTYVFSLFLAEEETETYAQVVLYNSSGSSIASHSLKNVGVVYHCRIVVSAESTIGVNFKTLKANNRVNIRVVDVRTMALTTTHDAIDIRTHAKNLLMSTDDMSNNYKNTGNGITYTFNGDTVTWTTTSTGWPYFVLTKPAIPLAVLSESDTMTISVDLRCTSGGGKVYLQVCTTGIYTHPTPRIKFAGANAIVGGSNIVHASSDWVRYSYTFKTDLSTWTREGSGSDDGIALMANLYYNDTGTIEFRCPQLELGSEATEYEPYRGTITPVTLNGHELRSLPDGTQDELTVDVDGRVTMIQRVGAVGGSDLNQYNSSNGYVAYKTGVVPSACKTMTEANNLVLCSWTTTNESFNSSNMTKECVQFPFGTTTTNIMAYVAALQGRDMSDFLLLYPLATPQTIDLGTIDMPQVQDGDTIEVIAAVTPSIDATWWATAGQAVADAYANLSSAIDVRAESITSTVASTYATSEAVQAISSQIEQTANGWTAKFNQLTGGEDLTMTLAEAFESLGVTSANLEQIRSFVRITTDSNGDPLLLMGSATSPIMLALSNDSLEFRHGADRVAYIDVDSGTNEGMLHITRAVVVKELQFGSWKWFEREGNGNMALKWVGEEE